LAFIGGGGALRRACSEGAPGRRPGARWGSKRQQEAPARCGAAPRARRASGRGRRVHVTREIRGARQRRCKRPRSGAQPVGALRFPACIRPLPHPPARAPRRAPPRRGVCGGPGVGPPAHLHPCARGCRRLRCPGSCRPTPTASAAAPSSSP
jgi:hypothetical protein